MSTTPTELVKNVGDLVSLPDVCIRVNQMVDNPDATAPAFGEVISQDPGLTARLLRIANSAFYGFSHEIDTVSRAVTVIGIGKLRDLVLATSTVDVFDKIPNELLTMENFWRHSLYCALISRSLAMQTRLPHGESLFIAGLLHDIGQLVIFHEMPDEARQALLLTIEGDAELEVHEAEREVMGFDHTDVGLELARQWNLPESLQEAIKYHHNPSAADKFQTEVAIVHLANSLACLLELNSSDESVAPATDPFAWEITGITKPQVEAALEESRQQFDEVRALFIR